MFGIEFKSKIKPRQRSLRERLEDAYWMSLYPLHKDDAKRELRNIASLVPDPLEPPSYKKEVNQ